MKTNLSIEESARLIELGVDPKLSSTICLDFNGTYAYVSGDEKDTVRDCVNGEYYTQEPTIFTLSDLLSILPKEIDDYHLSIEASNEGYDVAYMLWDGVRNESSFIGAVPSAPELIDALNSLLIWCLEQGYCKCGKGGGK